MRQRGPAYDFDVLETELRAVAALGRTTELHSLLDEIVANPIEGEPQRDKTAGHLMRNAAQELR